MIALTSTSIGSNASLDGALAGKVAIVTGASRGIGAVSSRAFARAGAAVVLAARDEQAITTVAAEIQAAGGDFDQCVRVNLGGVFLAMKYEIAAMLDAGGGGAIVNMSSTAGVNGVPRMGAYAAAKHGVIGLTRTAAIDYADRAIRVNAIAPGPILTERIAALPDTVREQISRSVPMGRLGDPEEVAAAAVWLCSDQAGFITGATLPIDGARTSRNA